MVTIGLGTDDGRDEFAGVPFRSLPKLADIGNLDSIVVFVNEPHLVATKYPAFLILHNPPPIREKLKEFAVEGTKYRTLIVTSRYARGLWSKYLKIDSSALAVVYPFAEPCFGVQPRLRNSNGTIRILFAGRLSPEKGIYTLLETLHIDIIEQDVKLTFTVTTAGADKLQGKIIEKLVRAHPGIDVVATRKTPVKMAFLPLSMETRKDASTKFTVAQSVDSLLKVLFKPEVITIEPLEELIRAPLAQVPD